MFREKELIQWQEYHVQQLQEKDQEYNALVKVLKDRVSLKTVFFLLLMIYFSKDHLWCFIVLICFDVYN